MPQSILAELGAAMLEEQRQKEQQKNANSLAKMRQEALVREAQSQQDYQRGASDTAKTIDPLINLWQTQAAQMSRETAEARERNALTSSIALEALRENVASQPTVYSKDVMSDVSDVYKNMMRMEVVEGLQRGEYPEPWKLEWTMPGVTHPGITAQKEMTKIFEQEGKDKATLQRQVIKDWNNEMDMIKRSLRSEDTMYNKGMQELVKEQKIEITKRYIRTLETMGIDAPEVMYSTAEMVKPIPPMYRPKIVRPKDKTSRLTPKKGGRVYQGRSDIRYGKIPLSEGYKPLENEQAVLRQAYKNAITELYPMWPEEDVENVIDEMMNKAPRTKYERLQRAQKPLPYGGKVPSLLSSR